MIISRNWSFFFKPHWRKSKVLVDSYPIINKSRFLLVLFLASLALSPLALMKVMEIHRNRTAPVSEMENASQAELNDYENYPTSAEENVQITLAPNDVLTAPANIEPPEPKAIYAKDALSPEAAIYGDASQTDSFENIKIVTAKKSASPEGSPDIGSDTEKIAGLTRMEREYLPTDFENYSSVRLSAALKKDPTWAVPKFYKETLASNIFIREFEDQQDQIITSHKPINNIFDYRFTHLRRRFSRLLKKSNPDFSPVPGSSLKVSRKPAELQMQEMDDSAESGAGMKRFFDSLTLFTPAEGVLSESILPELKTKALQAAALIGLGLMVWAALLFYLPRKQSKSFKNSLTARFSASLGLKRLAEKNIRGAPLLRVTFHDIPRRKGRRTHHERTVVRVQPHGVMKGKG